MVFFIPLRVVMFSTPSVNAGRIAQMYKISISRNGLCPRGLRKILYQQCISLSLMRMIVSNASADRSKILLRTYY